MLHAKFSKKVFYFKNPSGTSRGILTEKHSWFIELVDEENTDVIGLGECSIIPGLSPDFIDAENYERKLDEVCSNIEKYLSNFDLLIDFPSILFGIETAFLDLKNGGQRLIFKNNFSEGKQKIAINGLIWMGDALFMKEQIEQKLADGFSCLKMKIGAIDFKTELKILESIRNRFSASEITLRVDANGAFSYPNAIEKLNELAQFDLHSIEQPIQKGQWENMRQLCSSSKIPIALDEELIGIQTIDEKKNLIETIQPQYIILKPSLHGGIKGCREWIQIAEEKCIPWWITSALESNVGLNAIAQFTGEFTTKLPQGLGTGGLYTNNIPSRLRIENGELFISGNVNG